MTMMMMMTTTTSGPGARAGTGDSPPSRFLLPLLLLVCALVFHPPCAHSHPQPCQVLRRIGHTVRVGALNVQPRLLSLAATRSGFEDSDERHRELEKVQARAGAPGHGGLRSRGAASGQRGANRSRSAARQREENAWRESRVFAPRDSVLLAAEALNRAGLLPYNLSLELVMAVGSGLGELPAFSFSSAGSPVGEDPMSFLESVCHTVVVQGVSAMLAFPRNRDEFVKLDFLSQALQVPVVSVVQREFVRRSEVKKKKKEKKFVFREQLLLLTVDYTARTGGVCVCTGVSTHVAFNKKIKRCFR